LAVAVISDDFAINQKGCSFSNNQYKQIENKY